MTAATVVRRIALPTAVDVPVLRAAWRLVRTRQALGELGVVRWRETDPVLHELAAAELAEAPLRDLRCTVLSTGSRSELHVNARPERVDVDRLGHALHELAGTYRAVLAGRLTLPSAEDATPQDTTASARTGAPLELTVLRAAGRPHLHLHYPGSGGASAYRQLAAALPSSWTITALEDDASTQDLDGESQRYLAALGDRFAAPDLLGGWSLGGLVGLAAVRRYPATPPALLLVDSPPPGLLGADAIPPDLVRAFAAFLWKSMALRRFQPVELDVRDDDLGLALLSVALRRAGEDVPIAWLTDWLAQYRRRLQLLAGYPLAERTEVRALLLLGSLLPEQVARWRQVIGAGLTVRDLGGGHFDLLRDPLLPEVARELIALMTTSSHRTEEQSRWK